MSKLLYAIILFFFFTTPLFGQSSEENETSNTSNESKDSSDSKSNEENKFTFRSLVLINSLDYNLDKNSGVGLVIGSFPRNINENNIEKSSNNFIGFFYAYTI